MKGNESKRAKGSWIKTILRAQVIPSVIRMLGHLPLKVLQKIGASIGASLYFLNTKGAKVTRLNLSVCLGYPEQQLEELVRQSMISTWKTLLESAYFWQHQAEENLRHVVTVQNLELFDQALEDDRGLLLLVPHLGNWELLNAYLQSKTSVISMFRPPKIKQLESLLYDARLRTGIKLVPTNRSGVGAILKHLKSAQTAVILPDQEPRPESGVLAPFFGVEAYTIKLVNKLIEKTGCRVLMVCAIRNAYGEFDVIFSEPAATIYSDDHVLSATALNASVESCIGLGVDQYQWSYQRFKRGPRGKTKIYKNCSVTPLLSKSEKHLDKTA